MNLNCNRSVNGGLDSHLHGNDVGNYASFIWKYILNAPFSPDPKLHPSHPRKQGSRKRPDRRPGFLSR